MGKEAVNPLGFCDLVDADFEQYIDRMVAECSAVEIESRKFTNIVSQFFDYLQTRIANHCKSIGWEICDTESLPPILHILNLNSSSDNRFINHQHRYGEYKYKRVLLWKAICVIFGLGYWKKDITADTVRNDCRKLFLELEVMIDITAAHKNVYQIYYRPFVGSPFGPYFSSECMNMLVCVKFVILTTGDESAKQSKDREEAEAENKGQFQGKSGKWYDYNQEFEMLMFPGVPKMIGSAE